MQSTAFRSVTASLFIVALTACGGGGGGSSPSANTAAALYSVGGTISGLGTSTGLVLSNVGESLVVPPNAATFSFVNKLAQSSAYSVTVKTQPTGSNCSVIGSTASGNIVNSNVNTVNVICASTARVSTIAGNGGSGFLNGIGVAATFSDPEGVAVDSSGNVYVADAANRAIRKISPTGVVSTLAGTGSIGFVDGNGSTASFNHPLGLAVDITGNVYVSDSGNYAIRKISPAGIVTTLAGGSYGFVDGTGVAASFNLPHSVAVDNAGNVYVADSGNHAVRKISPAGIVTTLAGGSYGFADGTGTAAKFYGPNGIAVDSAGSVYVTDGSYNAIRKISPVGVVSTLAGGTLNIGFADGIGSAAKFSTPNGLAVDSSGTIYVADTYNNAIREISPDGVVITLVGGSYGFVDGIGTAAYFRYTSGVSVDGAGNLYVSDAGNNAVRKIVR